MLFLCPCIDRLGACSFWPVCLFVCPQNFLHWPHLLMVRVRTFIFHKGVPCDKTFLLVPSSRLSVKVEYQGHNFQKMGVAGAFLFHEHICVFSSPEHRVLSAIVITHRPSVSVHLSVHLSTIFLLTL